MEKKVKEVTTGYTFYVFQTKTNGSPSMKVAFHSLLENGWMPVGDDYE